MTRLKLTDLVEPITAKIAAKLLRCSRQRVGQLIAQGRLRAVKEAGVWFVERKSVEAYRASPRRPGPVPAIH